MSYFKLWICQRTGTFTERLIWILKYHKYFVPQFILSQILHLETHVLSEIDRAMILFFNIGINESKAIQE